MIFPDGLSEGRSHEAILRKVRPLFLLQHPLKDRQVFQLEDHFDDQTKLKLQNMKLQEETAKSREEARSERETLKKVLDELERTKKHSVSFELLKEVGHKAPLSSQET